MNKILVLLLSSSKMEDRLNAVLNTWYKTTLPPHEIKIVGDDILFEKYGSEKVWTCINSINDSRTNLTKKMLVAFKLSLEIEWDFLYKCDDDTFLNFPELEKFVSTKDKSIPLYAGIKITNPFPYAQGD